ncbi:hypothetical protein CRE_12271 [Caenorhabditis remanei]|uniref:Uncharacterized protein n=1 Tax=Caenorhabditis remanei TaxID=31234 RepID=E3NBC0_CAERE|nr:hypothetical protein CRE_12271 [Caenorhabditis remanei]
MENTPSPSSSARSSPSTTSTSSTPSPTLTTPAAPKRFAKKRDILQAFADLLDSPDEKRRRMENKKADRAKEAARKLAVPSISQPKDESKRPKRNSMDPLTHFNYVMSKKL